MSREIKQIVPPQQLSASITTLYTTPTNRRTVITRITLTNTTTTDRFVNLWLVPNGSTAQDENKILDGQKTKIAAGETFSPPDVEGQVLPTGDTIQAQAEVASAITIIGSGTEVTV